MAAVAAPWRPRMRGRSGAERRARFERRARPSGVDQPSRETVIAGMERDRDKGFPGGKAGGRCGRILVHGGGLRWGLRGQARHWGGGRQGVGTERRFAWNDDSPSFRAVMPFASRIVIWWWVS